MAEPIGRWGHSFEEDHGEISVYRPAGYEFPRARGRDGIEFCSDGSYIDWAIGANDAPERRAGTWSAVDGTDRPQGSDADRSKSEGAEQLRVTTATGARKVMRVVALADDRLELHITDQT